MATKSKLQTNTNMCLCKDCVDKNQYSRAPTVLLECDCKNSPNCQLQDCKKLRGLQDRKCPDCFNQSRHDRQGQSRDVLNCTCEPAVRKKEFGRDCRTQCIDDREALDTQLEKYSNKRDKENKRLDDLLTSLNGTIESLNREKQKLESELLQVRQNFKDLNKQNKELCKEIDKIKNDTKNMKNKRAKPLQSKLQSIKMENEKLSKTFEECCEEKCKLEEAIERQNKENQYLLSQSAKEKNKILLLNSELKRLETEILDLVKQHMRDTKKIEKLQKNLQEVHEKKVSIIAKHQAHVGEFNGNEDVNFHDPRNRKDAKLRLECRLRLEKEREKNERLGKDICQGYDLSQNYSSSDVDGWATSDEIDCDAINISDSC